MKTIVLLALLGGVMSAGAATGVSDDLQRITTLNGGARVIDGHPAYDSAGGGNPSVNVTNVPELASSVLGLIGAILLLRRRR